MFYSLVLFACVTCGGYGPVVIDVASKEACIVAARSLLEKSSVNLAFCIQKSTGITERIKP